MTEARTGEGVEQVFAPCCCYARPEEEEEEEGCSGCETNRRRTEVVDLGKVELIAEGVGHLWIELDLQFASSSSH